MQSSETSIVGFWGSETWNVWSGILLIGRDGNEEAPQPRPFYFLQTKSKQQPPTNEFSFFWQYELSTVYLEAPYFRQSQIATRQRKSKTKIIGLSQKSHQNRRPDQTFHYLRYSKSEGQRFLWTMKNEQIIFEAWDLWNARSGQLSFSQFLYSSVKLEALMFTVKRLH